MKNTPKQKVLLYARVNKNKAENIGVKRKLLAQLSAFRERGLEADLIWYGNHGIYLNNHLIYRRHFGHDLKDYLFFLWSWDALLFNILDISSYSLFYLRYALTHPGFLRFLHRIKSYPVNGRIILEFPTFPYDKELKSGSPMLRLTGAMDRLTRRSLAKSVNLVVHYGQGQVLNLPTVNITNGIDLEGISICKPNSRKNGLNIACLGTWNYWHGLDRLLEGVAIYQSEGRAVPLTVKIIGQGPALKELKQLTRKLGLEEIVGFYSAISKAELANNLQGVDIAVGALAMFRKNVTIDSSLKHREYCALGIPFILANQDPDFPTRLPFVHYVPADNSAIDLAEILQWLTNLKENHPNFQIEMRNYAKERLSWNIRIKTILAALDC